MKKLPALVAGLCLSTTLLAGCAAPTLPAASQTAQGAYFTDRDSDTPYDADTAVSLDLSQLEEALRTPGVSVDGSQVTLTQEGIYLISGQLAEGSLAVDAPQDAKVHLVLQEAALSNSTDTPLAITQADKVIITLEGNSSLSQTSEDAVSEGSSSPCAIASSSDLTLNGGGLLTITSAAGKGIDCKDDLVIAGGTYQIEAASHGAEANDSLCIKEASLQITSVEDGLHAENSDDASLGYVYVESGSLDIESQGDGVSASSWMDIADGSLSITSGDGAPEATPASNAQAPGEPPAQPGAQNGSLGLGGPGQDSSDAPGFGGKDSPSQGQTPPSGTMPPAMPSGEALGSNAQIPPAAGPENAAAPSDTSAVTGSTEDASDATSTKGLKAGSSLTVRGGTLIIDAEDDALHSDGDLSLSGGELELASGDDGAHAEGTPTVSGGAIAISTCYEGLEGAQVDVTDGTVTLTAADDGINASDGSTTKTFGPQPQRGSACAITISGGTLDIQASGDAIDSNGSLEITGGTIACEGPTQGDPSILDFDTTGTITGGTFKGTGAAKMVQTLTTATQGVLTVNTGSQQVGATVTLKDEAGAVVETWEPSQPYELIIFSSSQIKPGAAYQVQVGDQTLSVHAS